MPENVVITEDSWAPEDRKQNVMFIKKSKGVLSHLQINGAPLQLYNDTGIKKYKEKGCKYLTHRLVKKKNESIVRPLMTE